MTATARKYNPGFLSDEELISTFCVRQNSFDSLIECLRECTGSSNKHQIVIGPRGSGKTFLLLRVAAEIRRNEDLSSRFLPIVLAEENYEISTAGEFWLECLSRLADQHSRKPDEPDLELSYEEHRQIQDDRMLEDRCLGALQRFATRNKKRLVLIVENMNMMFDQIADRDAGWRLRHTLQGEPQIILIGSATSRFDEISNPDCALYDFLRVLTLRPLDPQECAMLWRTVSGLDRPLETIKALRILTGGSPRLLTILARFGSNLSFRDLMDGLLDLVDDHTEYFKSHLDALPAQERRVYLALAKLWMPATAREIADRARLDTSKCSAQLARLVDRGAVEVTGGIARRKQYYVAERLYNIYYLMRRARGAEPLVKALIQFMEAYYSPSELKVFTVRTLHEAIELDPEDKRMHPIAFKHLLESSSFPASYERVLAKQAPADSMEMLDQILDDPSQSPVEIADSLLLQGLMFSEQNCQEEALHEWNEVVHRFGERKEHRIVMTVAYALTSIGMLLTDQKRWQKALDVWDDIVRRIESADAEQSLQNLVYTALMGKAFALANMDKLQEAAAAYDEVINRNRVIATEVSEVLIARAMRSKVAVLVDLNRPKDALTVWNKIVRQFTTNDQSVLQKEFDTARLEIAGLHLTMGQGDTSIRMLNSLLESEGTESLKKIKCRGHLTRARAYFQGGDEAKCAHDVETALSILSEIVPPSPEIIDGLFRLALELDPAKLRELIIESPASDMLVPLTTALEKQLGLETRVAREIEEVAEEILRDLEDRRNDSNR